MTIRRPLAIAAFAVASLARVPRASAQGPDAAPTPPATATPPATPTPTPPATATPPALSVPPNGRAAPPTEAATRGNGPIRAGLEVFAQYTYRNTSAQDGGGSWFHVFDVPRVHGAVEGEIDRARGRVVIEGVRSASEGALVGVAGDSIVLRVREAFGAYRPIEGLDLAMGVLPTLTAPEMDGTWMLRAIAPSVVEASELASPADLGARARYDLPKGYGFVATAAYNGDGYASRELNRGKSIESAAEVHPLPDGALAPLGVFASYVAGSTGTSKARADRVTPGLVWQGERVRAGAFATWAWGVKDAGAQHAFALSFFARVEPLERVLVGARFDHVLRDTKAVPADEVDTIFGTVGYRLAEPLEVFLAVTRAIPTTRAESELPGTNVTDLRAVVRVVF